MKAIKALWRGKDSRGELYRRFPVGPAGKQIKVVFTRDLDGGGTNFGQDYLRILKQENLKVRHAIEWCCGPAFIGFSLLANGFCERLTLIDINPLAIDAVKNTIKKHRLENVVQIHHSDSLDSVPRGEPWDLVVGNPPHSGTDEHFDWGPDLIYKDLGWHIHRRFFEKVGQHLSPDGIILLQENSDCSTPETFAEMAEANGFKSIHTSMCPGYPIFYEGWMLKDAEPRMSPGSGFNSGPDNKAQS